MDGKKTAEMLWDPALVLNIAVGLVDTESELLLPVVRVCRGQGV